jgi:hypothetical protein
VPQFPHTWDNTMVGTAKSCYQKLYRTYLEHWKPGEESVDLVAGKAFAAGIETARVEYYVNGVDPEEAVALGMTSLLRAYGGFECPPDSAKSPARMAGALEFYFDNYKLGHDKAVPVFWGEKRGIEFSFAEPLPILHPVTGLPIIYTGRSDMVADAFGGTFVYDEKTASQLGPSWARQFDLRAQFTGYCWALRQAGMEPKGCVVRGVSILKTKYETQQVVTYRAGWEISRWLEQTCRVIHRAAEMWKQAILDEAAGFPPHNAFDYDLDHACTAYRGCALQRVCKSAHPEQQLPMYFHKRVWDPLAREEVSIEDWDARWAIGGANDLTVGVS